MFRALNTAATGMSAQEQNVSAISNNIANLNTTGFKKGRTEFEDLLYETITEAGSKSSATTEYNVGLQIGTGAKVTAIRKEFSLGDPQLTNNPFDFMIRGQGFFGIIMPSGQVQYTRDGSFNVEKTGTLVDKNGYKVFPGLVFPPNTKSVHVSTDGKVDSYIEGQVEPVNIGQMPVFTFINPVGLKSMGRNLFRTTTSSGTAIQKYSGDISVRNVTFTYQNLAFTLIDEINFSVNSGEVLCISGQNGSGKSTLAKLLAGLLDPGQGHVLASGIDLQQLAPNWWRKQIIYLPQEPYFINGSIKENFNAFNPGLTTGEIRNLLVEVGLETLADESPGGLNQSLGKGGFNFSLGVRRRLALARALCHDGPLAILDEPTEGIDAIGASYVYKIMNGMVRNGKTIIACSHDREIIRGAHLFLDLNERPRPIIKDIKTNEPA